MCIYDYTMVIDGIARVRILSVHLKLNGKSCEKNIRLFLTGNVSLHVCGAGWLLLLPRVYVHISTDQIRHLVLLFNSSSSRLDYYTCRAWQDPWMSLALSGQPRWCDTPPRVHSECPAQQDKNLILTISNFRQKFWFHKIISKKKTIFIENLFWTDVFYL